MTMPSDPLARQSQDMRPVMLLESRPTIATHLDQCGIMDTGTLDTALNREHSCQNASDHNKTNGNGFDLSDPNSDSSNFEEFTFKDLSPDDSNLEHYKLGDVSDFAMNDILLQPAQYPPTGISATGIDPIVGSGSAMHTIPANRMVPSKKTLSLKYRRMLLLAFKKSKDSALKTQTTIIPPANMTARSKKFQKIKARQQTLRAFRKAKQSELKKRRDESGRLPAQAWLPPIVADSVFASMDFDNPIFWRCWQRQELRTFWSVKHPELKKQKDGLWGEILRRGEAHQPVVSSSRLFRLPLEIRTQIYQYAIDNLPYGARELVVRDRSLVSLGTRLFSRSRLPAVAFTNRQALYEAVLTYLSSVQFVFTHDPVREFENTESQAFGSLRDKTLMFTGFLANFPDDQGFRSIRSIKLDLGYLYVYVKELLELATGLRHVTIVFQDLDFSSGSWPRTIDGLIGNLYFEVFCMCADMPKLEELVLSCTLTEMSNWELLQEKDFHNIIELMKDFFTSRGKNIKILLVITPFQQPNTDLDRETI